MELLRKIRACKYSGLTVFGVTFFRPAFVITGCESAGQAGSPYMTRYRLIDSKRFALYLHIFHRSDDDTYHNHPWGFTSFVLLNGYVEEVPTVYPDWKERPDHTAAFYAACGRTPTLLHPPKILPDTAFFDRVRALWLFRVQRRHAPRIRADFRGEWKPGQDYPTGSVVHSRYSLKDGLPYPSYWYLTDARENNVRNRQPTAEKSNPPAPVWGWKLIDPATPRRLDVRPFSLNRRPSCFVHRVKLRRRKNGSERPAVGVLEANPRRAQPGNRLYLPTVAEIL